jgi:predicted phage terminase large subunit-like protein
MNNLHNHDVEMNQGKLMLIVKDQSVRRELTKACHHWFFHVYFAHYVKYNTARFQKELFEVTEDESSKTVVIEAFRGSGKTTVMGTSYAIWSILGVQQKKFVLMIAKTESQARQYLANIKIELESNGLLRSDLGPFEEPDDEWRATSIVLPKYGARITVASVESSIRGIKHGAHRPDLIICDDLEDLDIVKTAESRDKMYKWLTGDIMPLGDKHTRFVVIGTALHHDSLISKLKNAIIEGRMDGVTKRYPFLNADGIATWTEKFPTQFDIDTLRKSIPTLQAWEREYMLNIVSEDDQLIRREWIQYYDELPPNDTVRYTGIGVDPAIGQKSDNDSTAIVSGKICGRKKGLKIYVLPNPINVRMDFTETISRVKSLSTTLGNGVPVHLWIESVAYQKAIVDQLRSDGYPAKEWKTGGSDKRARLSLVSNHIQSGVVMFPRHGAEKLIEQLIGFGNETHDDLCDALGILVLSVIEQDSRMNKGYHPLFDEKLLNGSYSERIPMYGDGMLGVILADTRRTHSTIVLRTKEAAELLYYEAVTDADIVARKVVELALKYDVPLSNENIFIDNSVGGMELCKLVRKYAKGKFILDKYENYQRYGIDVSHRYMYNDGHYDDIYASGFGKLKKWLEGGGKLLNRLRFDDLIYVTWKEHASKMQIIDKETLRDDGIDVSIPDALCMTFVWEKRCNNYPIEEVDEEMLYPEIGI